MQLSKRKTGIMLSIIYKIKTKTRRTLAEKLFKN